MTIRAIHRFRLYITGNAPNSVRAMTNLSDLCRQYLPDRHEIEIVDLLQDPKRALSDHILITPTLVKWSPGPEARIVGSLSDRAVLLATLGLPDARAHGPG